MENSSSTKLTFFSLQSLASAYSVLAVGPNPQRASEVKSFEIAKKVQSLVDERPEAAFQLVVNFQESFQAAIIAQDKIAANAAIDHLLSAQVR